MTEGPRYYTTFQAAKLLSVSLATVVNWTRAGLLAAHRTPGGHRRIAEQDLVSFAREYNIPLPDGLGASEPGPARLLLVDDDPAYVQAARQFLELAGGYEVEVAITGFAAGLAVERFRPDVILMDLRMPGMDGFEVTERLRSGGSSRAIPVICCTAFADPAARERIAEVFDGFLEKPFDLEELLRSVRDVLS